MIAKTPQEIEKQNREHQEQFKAGTLCYLEESKRPMGLVIHHQDGSMQILPYAHFLFADYLLGPECDGGREDTTLYLLFATHDVAICGRHLRGIALLIGQNLISAIRQTPSAVISQEPSAGQKQPPCIRSVAVALRSDRED